MRERWIASLYLSAAWMLIVLIVQFGRPVDMLIGLYVLWRADRNYELRWLDACRKAGVDKSEVTGC